MNRRLNNRPGGAPFGVGSEPESLDHNLYSRVTRWDWRGALRPKTEELGASKFCCKGEEAADHLIASILLAHVEASQSLSMRRERFLQIGRPERTPFVIAVAGSAVHVGEPSIVCILERALTRHPSRPKVEMLDARRFDVPVEYREEFPFRVPHFLPETTDGPALLEFLVKLKGRADDDRLLAQNGKERDSTDGEGTRPNILLLSGPTLLSQSLHGQQPLPFIFDYFDFSIYVETADCHLASWYELLSQNGMQGETLSLPKRISSQRWLKTVRRNLTVHVKPTRSRADLILQIGESCQIEDALVRKI